MGFPDSIYRSLDAELLPASVDAARWHHALAVLLAVAAIAIGCLIGG